MIKAHTIPDWFVVPAEYHKKYLRGVPGVLLHGDDDRLVHRTHLPLLQDQLDVRQFDSEIVDVGVWLTRLDQQSIPVFHNDELRDYQDDAVYFIQQRRSSLIDFTPRLGKTAIAVGGHRPEDGQLLVVAPLSTRHVWLDWFKRRWPDIKPAVLRGQKFDPKILNSPLVFVNYDILANWQTQRMNIGMLVLDEAHFLANNRSKRSKAVQFFATQAKRVVLLTGTPIWNRLNGLWSMLHIISPGAWGTYFEFTKRYCAGYMSEYGWVATGFSNQEELQARLTGCMIRKTWRDVVDELPATTRVLEIVSVSWADQLRIDDEVRRLRDASKKETKVGDLARLRRLLGKLKIKAAIDAAIQLLDNDEPVVLWVWHKDVASAVHVKLRIAGKKVVKITGDTPGDRGDLINEWKKLGTAVLVINLAVGQVGIDLSHARHAVFAEQDWTPAVIAQAEMRTFSPDRPMFITHVVADHLVDIKVADALLEKVRLANFAGFATEEIETVNIFKEILGDTATLWDDEDPVSWLLNRGKNV